MADEKTAILEVDDESSELSSAEEQLKVPFEGLDLRSARCFGYSIPKDKNWKTIAEQADSIGWKLVDLQQLEKSLTTDVDLSYLKIAEFKLVNVDDDTKYMLWFDNNKALWGLAIADSPKAEMPDEEREGFFNSSMFLKIAKKTYYKLCAAKDVYNSIVQLHLENAELLLVDTVKLSAILHFLDTAHFLDNLLNGKHLNY